MLASVFTPLAHAQKAVICDPSRRLAPRVLPVPTITDSWGKKRFLHAAPSSHWHSGVVRRAGGADARERPKGCRDPAQVMEESMVTTELRNFTQRKEEQDAGQQQLQSE